MRAGQNTVALEKALARMDSLIAVKDNAIKSYKPKTTNRATKQKPKPKLTPEELKAFRIELMAKARAAKKAKRGK